MKTLFKHVVLLMSITMLAFVSASCGGGSSAGQPANEHISSIDPADGATDVDFFAPVTVVFNRDINETTLTAANVKLTTANGVYDVPCTISYDAATKTLTLTPTFPYWAESQYSLTISNAVVTKANGDANDTQSTFTTPVRPVLYRSNLDASDMTSVGQWNVWTMNADGSDMTPFTNNAAPLESSWGFFANSWSPGYQYVAYQVVDLNAPYSRDLWVANSDGSNPVNITEVLVEGDYARVEEVMWAPDASKIYFVYRVAEQTAYNLYEFDVTEARQYDSSDPGNTQNNPRRLTPYVYDSSTFTGNTIGEEMRISPDGTRIIYRLRSLAPSEEVVSLQLIALDSTAYDIHSLTHVWPAFDSTRSIYQPEYSPDGTKVFFKAGDAGTTANQNLYVGTLNSDGTEFDAAPSALRPLNIGESFGAYGVSPDGQQIAYTFAEQAGTASLSVMNADGTGNYGVASTPDSLSRPLWSPDGTMIAYGMGSLLVGEAFNLYVADSSGTATALNLTNFTTRFQYDGKCLWSTDSAELMFTVNDTINGNSHIWKAIADGTSTTNITQVGGLGVSFALFDWWQPAFDNIAQ